jgi:hypothetical protein
MVPLLIHIVLWLRVCDNMPSGIEQYGSILQMIYIADMAIQVEWAREGHSFVLKMLYLNFGKSSLIQISELLLKNMLYQTNQITLLYLILLT